MRPCAARRGRRLSRLWRRWLRRGGGRGDGLAIGLAFVATRRNIGSLPGLLALAHDRQLDFVSVSNVAPHTPEMAAEMLWGGAAWAASFPDASWRPRLELARMTLDEQSRPALAALLDHGPTWPPPGAAGGPQRNHCRFAHEGMLAVAWDGRVAPCLSLLHTHPEYVNGHWKTVHSHAVGQVDERPLLDIWRDVTYRDFRQRLRVFDFAALSSPVAAARRPIRTTRTATAARFPRAANACGRRGSCCALDSLR